MSFDSLLKQSSSVTDVSKYELYYEGKARLDALGISLPPAVRILEMVAPFPKLSVDILTEVLVPEGYILGSDSDTPQLLRRFWQSNNMDTLSRLMITESLVQGAAYWVVGAGDDRSPRITGHKALGVSVSYDHLGRVSEGMRRYRSGDDKFLVHYLPGRNDYYKYTYSNWVLVDQIKTGISRPAIVPMRNQMRLDDMHGRSEIAEIIGITDAASRSLTNLQAAQEALAMPTKYLFGEGLEAMKDGEGKPIDKVAAYFGAYITGPKGSTAGQIPGADLTQIINSYKLYSQIVSACTGIPPSMLGISTDNPSSAEALRVAKDRLITRAEAKASMFGDALEDVARIALEFMGELPLENETLELRWRDPATPSQSAQSAAMLQAHAQGIVSAETAQEQLRLTPQQLERERAISGRANALVDQMGG